MHIINGRFGGVGRHLASGAIDGAVHLLNAESGTLIRKLEGHTKAIRSLSFAHGASSLKSRRKSTVFLIQLTSSSLSSLLLSSLEFSDTQSLRALNTSPSRNRCTFLCEGLAVSAWKRAWRWCKGGGYPLVAPSPLTPLFSWGDRKCFDCGRYVRARRTILGPRS